MDDDVGQRFWSKVEVGDCWEWTATKDRYGYGQFRLDGKMVSVHRLAYQSLVGPIPDWLQIDHLCRNRACVNPDHTEPVTQQENVRRGVSVNGNKTHCPQGHPYDEANTYIYPDGRRGCRTCIKAAGRRSRARQKEAA